MLPEDPSYNDLCKDNYFAIHPCAEPAYKMARAAKDNGLDMDDAMSYATEAFKKVWGLEDTLPTAKVVDADSIDAAISSLGDVKGYAQRRLDRNNKQDREVLDKLVNSNRNHHVEGTHPMNHMPPQYQIIGNEYIQQPPFNHPQSWPGYHHHQMLMGHVPHIMHGSQLQAHMANGHNALARPINDASHGKVAPNPKLTRPVNNLPHGKGSPEPKKKMTDQSPCSPSMSIFDDVVKVYIFYLSLGIIWRHSHLCSPFLLKQSLLNANHSTPLVCLVQQGTRLVVIVYHIPRLLLPH
mmetsp:Transcript_31742/g.67630  ORF Transcript_31742/g.67630 Transcript_31742/m.67630 type:complete len:295 (-) Transcript_31742:1277-2161(-)